MVGEHLGDFGWCC